MLQLEFTERYILHQMLILRIATPPQAVWSNPATDSSWLRPQGVTHAVDVQPAVDSQILWPQTLTVFCTLVQKLPLPQSASVVHSRVQPSAKSNQQRRKICRCALPTICCALSGSTAVKVTETILGASASARIELVWHRASDAGTSTSLASSAIGTDIVASAAIRVIPARRGLSSS